MSAINDRYLSRDAIERFLDRSWMQQQTPPPALAGHRVALEVLDDWIQKHRVATLSTATADDVRALLSSPQWDTISRGCEALLGLLTRFYRSLQECHFRGDDPVEALIDQELAAAARKRANVRTPGTRRVRKLTFRRPRVV